LSLRPKQRPSLAYADTIPARTIEPRSHSVSDKISESTRETREERFDRILREFGPGLSRLALGYERAPSAREELTQEIALAIWQALPHFRGECTERTFVYRIAHNRSLTHAYRRQPAHQPLDELPQPLEPIDPRPHPEEQVAITRRRDRLRYAIQRLPLAPRQVIMLMLEDLSHEEIAEILGITENNVGVRLNRARKLLKESMEEPS
jgi:RNA polymerase sigma factor (sigma-70 family)